MRGGGGGVGIKRPKSLKLKVFFLENVRNTRFLQRFFSFGSKVKNGFVIGVFVCKSTPCTLFANWT